MTIDLFCEENIILAIFPHLQTQNAMKRPLIFALTILLLSGCSISEATPSSTASTASSATAKLITSTINPTQTATLNPTRGRREESTPTLIFGHWDTSTPDPNGPIATPIPTITAPPQREVPLDLPGDLQIEEYPVNQEIVRKVYLRHPDMGGWYYWPQGGMINDELFWVEEVELPDQQVMIRAMLGESELGTFECGHLTVMHNVITAWVYQEHWIIQSYCNQKFDVLWDGVSLNENRGYESSFGFQLLDEKPFYLFKRDGKIWISYDGEEALLGYDDVKLQYCCEPLYSPPQAYERMALFFATQDDHIRYVAIGIFDK